VVIRVSLWLMRSLAVLLMLSLCVHAQEPQDVVRISTNLVQIDVVVTKDGKQVKDLKLEDFELREDGRLQLNRRNLTT
jgi:hypothetical protein